VRPARGTRRGGTRAPRGRRGPAAARVLPADRGGGSPGAGAAGTGLMGEGPPSGRSAVSRRGARAGGGVFGVGRGEESSAGTASRSSAARGNRQTGAGEPGQSTGQVWTGALRCM